MREIPFSIHQSIDKYEPIHVEGLTLYPIQVKDYYDYTIARSVLSFLPQSLPIELMSKPLLQALYLTDMGVVESDTPKGLFMSALLLLSLSLRLMPDGTTQDRIRKFELVVEPNDPTRLKALRFVLNGEEQVDITPVQFSRLLPYIAAQNGAEEIDTDANPELVQAEEDLIAAKAPKLEYSIDGLITSVSVISRVEKAEIYDWAILKLNHYADTYKRILDFIICGIGESQGTTWKGGNPVPHPYFPRIKEGSNALVGMDSFVGGQAMAAVNNPDADARPPEIFNKNL